MSELFDKINAELEAQNKIINEYRKTLDDSNKTVAEIKEASAKFEKKIEEQDKTIKNLEEEIAKEKALNAISNANKNPENKHFFNYIRTGVVSQELKNTFKNSGEVVIGTGSQGGYAVPTEVASEIMKLASKNSVIRQLARVISVRTPNYSELVDKGGTETGWVGETSPRPQTNAPTLASVSPVMGEIYSNLYASQYALDDIDFDVANWLVNSATEAFEPKEEAAFISGDGSNKPKGIFANTITNEADDVRAFGSLQYIPTGDADSLPSTTSVIMDLFLDMITNTKVAHLKNAHFLMNRSIKGKLLKIKDSQNRYIWQPSVVAGQPDLLFNYPVAVSDCMANEGANAYIAAFGDFKKAYTIVDRLGIYILRDPYTNPPFTKFYVSKRVGSMLKDSEAIKVLKCAES
jgi:HK97 family phage major capsid protein